MSSEFGKGYVTCLAQFANHSERLDQFKSYTGPFSGLEMWFNASSDHLYDLQRPKRIRNSEWTRAKRVQDRALDVGHGSGLSGKSGVTRAEAELLIKEATSLVLAASLQEGVGFPMNLPDCIELDIKLGLKHPDGGTWSCSENFRPRP